MRHISDKVFTYQIAFRDTKLLAVLFFLTGKSTNMNTFVL